MPGKPDFLDLDKDGNTTEPMKSAAKKKMMRGGKVKMMRGGKVPGMMRGGKVPGMMRGGSVDGMDGKQMNAAMGVQDVPMTSGGIRKMRDGGRVF